jgi:hypothetical protein
MVVREKQDVLVWNGIEFDVGRWLLDPIHIPCKGTPPLSIHSCLRELRNYWAQWRIHEGQLLLTKVVGSPRISETPSPEASRLLAILKRLENEPVPAIWVRDTVKCFRGDHNGKYRDTYYGRVYPHELWIDVDDSVISWVETRDNTNRLAQMWPPDIPEFLLEKPSDRTP